MLHLLDLPHLEGNTIQMQLTHWLQGGSEGCKNLVKGISPHCDVTNVTVQAAKVDTFSRPDTDFCSSSGFNTSLLFVF